MDSQNTAAGMLALLPQPAFLVEGGVITHVNPAAEQLFLSPGTEIAPLLSAQEEYAAFTEGSLLLRLTLPQGQQDARVTRVGGQDVFILEQGQEQSILQALALAAAQLRQPLNGIMTITDTLLPALAQTDDPAVRQQTAQLNRGLYQILRMVGNMSDAARYSNASAFQPETRNICDVLDEIFRQAQALVWQADVSFDFSVPTKAVYCPVDSQLLERAVLNLISNALKFTPSGGSIVCRACQKGNVLHLSVTNSSPIPHELLDDLFCRYLRAPTIEDGRYGIGLGMALVRAAAAAHGGTVLVELPDENSTRITMTISLTMGGTVLRSPILPVDYTGEHSHSLVELADCLPPEEYAPGEKV